MNKKIIISLSFLSAIALLIMVSFVRADDGENDNENENEKESSSSPSSSKADSQTVEMITQTIVLEPARTVTTTIMENVDIPDSDRDGIPDEQDMYPNIPLQMMVNDANFDGIDDRYEIQNTQQ